MIKPHGRLIGLYGSLLFLVAAAFAIKKPAAFAASFDCGKAGTKIERTICADPKLSVLDDELAKVYKEALGLASDQAALKKSQQNWLRKVRSSAETPDYITAVYLARIEEIRLDPKLKRRLFAETAPPASIFGRYSETEPQCSYPKEGEDEYDCGESVESYIDIKAGPGNSVTVTGELFFFNGFVCGPFEGKAEWMNDSLRMPNLENEEARCVLIMRFRDGKIFTEDPGSFCKDALGCGANAGFHILELPKLTDRGGDSAKGGKYPGRSQEVAGRPGDIVRKYCALDAEGARLSSITFKEIGPLITWDEEPGWDTATVISEFEMGDTVISGDEARVTVRYHKLGENGGGFRKERGVEKVVFVLVRKEEGWKIREPLINPHVGKAAIIKHYRGLQKDSPARYQELEGVIRKIEVSSK